MAYKKSNPNGQATMANSEPVVIASDQSTIPVSVSGVATAANQTTIIGHVDGIEGLLTTIDADTSALAGAVAGTEVQVDVVAALPAGTNNIGDVDVLTLPAVNFQDVYVTGQGSQTALNNNVILASAGASSYDTLNGTTGISFRSWSIQVVPAAGTVTAGVITFEGSNNNTNFTPIFMVDEANITAVPVSSYTLAASTTRYFKGTIAWRYVRARISTGVTGTTTGVQAFSRFSTQPFTDNRLTVSQATAASLNVTASGTVTANLGTGGTGATSLGKARDGAAGATDTNVATMMIRRDTPTAVTPVAGDYEIPQISANGEQWVRDAVDIADDAAITLGTNRVKPIAGVAVNMDGTDPTAVSAEGDAAAVRTDPNRILLVNQTHPRYFRASADYASAQTNTSVVAAPGAGLSLWITDIVISNGATAGNITLLDGSGGSVVFEIYPAVNGGVAHSFRNPIKLTANTALVITSTTVTTHAVNVTGYIAA